MSFATTISALSSKVDGLIANRVAKFAYTQQAYNSDTVNGVTEYDFNNEQNIPTSTASVLKVNETILTKGWRTQASAITRMLMNHFLGRTSYNLNKTVDFLKDLMTAITDNMGVAEGFATLDVNGRIPSSQLTEEVMEYKGEWNADTNTPELDEETGKKGDVYKVTVSGTQDLGEGEKYYRVNTYIVFDGTAYTVLSGEDVAKVNNIAPDAVGNVTLTGENIATSSVDNMSLADKIRLNLKRSFGYLLGRYFEEITFPFVSEGATWQYFFYYANEMYFVTCTHFGVKVSTDLKTWYNTNLPVGEKYIICFIKNIWVALPQQPVSDKHIWYSMNGKEWVSTETEIDVTLYYIVTKDMILISVNTIDSESVSTCALYKTNDGKTWTLVEYTTEYWSNFYFTGNKFFAFKDRLYTSSDGETWIATTMMDNFIRSDVSLAYKDDMYVGCFASKGICYSADGITWTQTSITDTSYNRIVYANGLFVTTSSSASKAVIKSTDGITWNNTNVTKIVYSLFYANGIWLMKTSDSLLYHSYDGATWITSSYTSTSINDVSYSNGVFIITSSGQGVSVSSDGVNWLIAQKSGVFNSSNIYPVFMTKDLFLYKNSNSSKYYISSLDLLEEKGWLNLD